jgi:hypothetical protein
MSIRLLLLLMSVFSINITGQSLLEKRVTLQYQNENAGTVFKEIQKQTGVIFSYSSFNDEKRLSIIVNNTPLKNVVAILEKELSVQILLNDKYLIVRPLEMQEPKEIFLKGAISDLENGVPLQEASIYIKEGKSLVNSDEHGKFGLKLPKGNRQLLINVAKSGYIDTTVVIVATKDQQLNIFLRNYPRERIKEFEELSDMVVQVDSKAEQENPPPPNLIETSYVENFWEKKQKQYANLKNISDTIFSSISLSLIPPISTNKLLSFNTINTLSINIIGGHSKGLNGVEVGGVYNFDAGQVYGVQVAGVSNIVKEDVIGVQVGGVMNGVGGKVSGLQVAGVVNYTDEDIEGLQIAGVIQRVRHIDGLQISGVINQAKSVNGLQIGGVLNNVDSSSTNVQIAGVVNKEKNIIGAQISGVVNICDTLKGVQIGLFNFAKNIDKGFAIGLVNYVRDGYHKLELSRNELGTYGVGYRSGWAPLHFHYFGGLNLQNADHRFVQAGVGLGSSIPLSKKWNMELDATTRSTNDIYNNLSWNFNMYNQLLVGVSWQPIRRLGVRTGLTLNHFWYDPTLAIHQHIADMGGKAIYANEGVGKNHKVWLGWQVGILF